MAVRKLPLSALIVARSGVKVMPGKEGEEKERFLRHFPLDSAARLLL